MNDDYLLILLRDCFTGGYTLPQFCRDNNFRKPLFVAEKKFALFIWEIYVQFHYEVKLADCDAVICLTARKIFGNGVIYLDILTNYFISKTYAEIPLLNFLQRYPRVKLFMTNFPSVWRHKNARDFVSRIKSLDEMRTTLAVDKSGTVPTVLDKFGYTNQEVLELMNGPKVKTNPDGSTDMQDTDDNSLQRIKNGRRVTANQPAHFKNRIYFIGSCHHYGVNAPFDKTIASYLQRLLNEKNLPYRVENVSQRYWNRYQDIFYNLNKLTPAPGDILFVWLDDMATMNLPFVDVADAFDPPHDYREIFFDNIHVNELGYKILAEKYFAFLTANNFFRNVEFKYATPPPNASVRYPAAVRAWQCECQRGA